MDKNKAAKSKKEEERYVCIRRCYHYRAAVVEGKKNSYRSYQPGDYLESGAPPNRHFVLEGETPEEEAPIVTTSGDDTRSTKQVIKDLKKIYGIDIDPTSTRKVAFKKWTEMETRAKIKAEEEEAAKDKGEKEPEKKSSK